MKNLGDDSPPRPITTLPGNQLVVQWPLDTLIVFESNEVQGGSRDLWMVDVSDPDSVRVDIYLSSEADLNGIAVSPDGTLAAYASDESGQDEIYIRSFPEPGGQTVVSDGGGASPLGRQMEIPCTISGFQERSSRLAYNGIRFQWYSPGIFFLRPPPAVRPSLARGSIRTVTV